MRCIHLVPLLAIGASCSFPQHVARMTHEDTIPASSLRKLHCTSHNGDITIRGNAGISEIRMRVKLAVRGYSQHEAEANLEYLEVHHEIADDLVSIAGRFDPAVRGMSPSFSFDIEAPAALVNKLVSHNGDIHAVQTNAALDCETHNGNIEASGAANAVRFISHNGDIQIELGGSGALDGSIITHNGDVKIGVAEALGTSLSARTHNGSIKLHRPADEMSRSRRKLECRLGNGSGRLEIETHNGDVEIR